MTEEQIAAVARGLTIGDRTRLRAAKNGVATLGKFSFAAIERLIDLRFAYATDWSKRDVTNAKLTPLGLAVRAYLLRNEP